MQKNESYLIIDIGTGNVRVAQTNTDGHVLNIATDTVRYIRDDKYKDALYFAPDELWGQITNLMKKIIGEAKGGPIKAITVSSQREGIVLLDRKGNSMMGLPNHDHRGREWEHELKDKAEVYRLTGRYPSSLFSAFKLVGVRKVHPGLFSELDKVMSISDWAQFKLSGVMGYEDSQASETLLYDVKEGKWSEKLCSLFDLDMDILPKIHQSGTILGKVLPEYTNTLDIPQDAVIVVGGADTQLAVMSTMPATDDVVIVAGTTTPIVKVVDQYIIDEKQRTWTNRHTESNSFILEANAGVTGLNYQRLKEIFYPNESYDLIEEELRKISPSLCIASLGSLIAEEETPLVNGGFIFNVPVPHDLTRANFVWATLWDIACCVNENYKTLCSVSGNEPDYVWACGGGIQSPTLRQFIANLINKTVKFRKGFRQSSVVGGAFICNQALQDGEFQTDDIGEIQPVLDEGMKEQFASWQQVRAGLKHIF
ncbi:FGGY-family carbohydrate kinase [Flagellimonas sp.]|uniref:FGGY-family carbohydrate kinase n=1 Tax=Flagellimonas sp. TaxID=2058762 RepID=UPI003AB3E9AF